MNRADEPDRHRTEAQRRGDAAEAAVADRLSAAGWLVLGRNVHVGRAEIDVLALDPGPPPRLVAVEVRQRSDRAWGLPEETFDRRKRDRLRAALGRLLETGRLPGGGRLPNARPAIDLVAVEPPDRPGGADRVRHHREVG